VKGARSRYRCDAPIWAAARGGLGRFTTRLMATVGLIVRDAVLRSFLRFPRHAWGLNAAKHDTGTAICCCWISQSMQRLSPLSTRPFSTFAVPSFATLAVGVRPLS
jgi:hypothetical protein